MRAGDAPEPAHLVGLNICGFLELEKGDAAAVGERRGDLIDSCVTDRTSGTPMGTDLAIGVAGEDCISDAVSDLDTTDNTGDRGELPGTCIP